MTAAASSLPACLLAEATVVQPTHLEGDASLATEILPGPPSLASIRQAPKKGDPKRPTLPLSYLPLYDPGTTYSGLVGGMITLDDGGSRRKRARVDSRFSSRSQRASARGLTNAAVLNTVSGTEEDTTATSQITLEAAMPSVPGNEDVPSVPSSSTLQIQEEGSGKNKPGRPRKSEQSGIAKEKTSVLVKEEPLPTQLTDITQQVPRNEDHCSSCTSTGALVYCDGCPRAFHLWCLDPPMEASELTDGDRWFCPRCKASEGPSARLPPSFLSPLIYQLTNCTPKEFQLPEDIRTHFKDVATASSGAYIDSSTLRPLRVGRHGMGEEREPYRLRDNKGLCTLCFACGKSALPEEVVPSTSSISDLRSQQWKSMISCDYCSLHWHLDCLNPPLTTLPPYGRKWKCPNHASNAAPKRRTPKNNVMIKDISGPNQYNNGNIEIINIEDSLFNHEKLSSDDVLINGTRYRVPERAIILDFWNKTRAPPKKPPAYQSSVVSLSSLSTLTSLDEDEDQEIDDDTLKVAQMLCNMQNSVRKSAENHHSSTRRTQDIAVQTDYFPTITQNTGRLLNGAKKKSTSIAGESSSIPHTVENTKTFERSPRVSQSLKAPFRVTRQRSPRKVDNNANVLQPESVNFSSDKSVNISTPPPNDSPSSSAATSLKIRIPALTPKAHVSSDIKQMEPDTSAGDLSEGAEIASGRPVRSTRLRAPKSTPSVGSESSSSRSGMTLTEDESRSNSDTNNNKTQLADDAGVKRRRISSGRVSQTSLPLKSNDIIDDESQLVEEAPSKRRRIPTLRKSESDSMVVDFPELTASLVRPRRKTRTKPTRSAAQRRLSSSASIQQPDAFLSSSSRSLVDEQSNTLEKRPESGGLMQSAVSV